MAFGNRMNDNGLSCFKDLAVTCIDLYILIKYDVIMVLWLSEIYIYVTDCKNSIVKQRTTRT